MGGLRGVGKSALLSNWAKRYAEHHPEDILVEHYIGCSPNSTSYSHLLWRVMNHVQSQLDESEQLPGPEEREFLPRFFTKVGLPPSILPRYLT